MAKGDNYRDIAEAEFKKAEATKLRVSFDYVEWDDDFFLHGLDAEYYKKLVDTLAEIKKSTEDLILQQRHPSLGAKSIFNTSTSTRTAFPKGVVDKIATKLKGEAAAAGADDANAKAKAIVDRAFEVRVGKSYGRIHAFVWDKVFHIVWFDPAHNLYPKKEHGIRTAKDYTTVKCFSPDAVAEFQEENRKLVDGYNELVAKLEAQQKEYDELMALWAEKN
jgi:hypothetical protein